MARKSLALVEEKVAELEAALKKAAAENAELLEVVHRANIAFENQDTQLASLKRRLTEPKGVRETKSAFAMLDARLADDAERNDRALGVVPQHDSLAEAAETIEGLRTDQRNRMVTLQNANREIESSNATIEVLRKKIAKLEERIVELERKPDTTRAENEDGWRQR